MKLITKYTLSLSALLASSGVAQNVTEDGSCGVNKTRFDPYIHKSTYIIGIGSIQGIEKTYNDTHQLFSEYLTATAGQKFDPPIEFTIAPNLFGGLFDAIEKDEMDFLYVNPGVYSCIGTQFGATALATGISRFKTRGRTFDLDVFGGVMAVRHDNDDINNIADLKNKIIGAGAITDIMGGQMQIYAMDEAGLSYVNDPKQVIFTGNQIDVVNGVISGRFDVGFVRTGQIERTKDDDGQLVDPELFKIIEPKIYLMESGEPFPFLHSTKILPEWAVVALASVPGDVQKAVQEALMEFKQHVEIGNLLNDCLASNDAQYCASLSLEEMVSKVPCAARGDLALLASEGSQKSNIAGFRTPRSYFELRTIQQEAGLLVQDEKGEWACIRPEHLYEGITCPQGYFKRSEREFESGCERDGLACDDKDGYDCFCKPCVKAFEVDVYQHFAGEEDPHLQDSFGDSLPGCEKMSVCGTFGQGDSLTLRIYDNMERVGAKVEVRSHAGDDAKTLKLKGLPNSGGFGYEFTVTDNEVQVHVIEILFDGEPISQSPIRVIVEQKNCDAVYGEESNRVSDKDGNCVCAGNTYEMGGICLDSVFFFLIIFAVVFLVVGVLVFLYIGYKKKQSDSVWHINVDELHFNEPPEIIGQGGFGVVILGQYRGTKVAVKRVLPPATDKRGNASVTGSGEGSADVIGPKIGVEIGSEDAAKKVSKSKDRKNAKSNGKGAIKNVKFGENSGDIESQTISHSGSFQRKESYSGSNKDWERMIMGHHSDNDILRILEAATTSDHGSGSGVLRSATASQSFFLKMLPMWLRFDDHSKRVSEFVKEMRLLSSLRHPCITTVMGAVVSNSVDPMLVMEFMEYGSLYDLLHNETMTPGGEIILASHS